MCTRVWDDQILCENQGEFAAYLGVAGKDLPLDHRYPESARGPEVCLCPIDVARALSDAGKAWEFDRGDPMEIIVTGTV